MLKNINITNFAKPFLNLFIFAVLVFVVGILFFNLQRGFNFTDEAYYILWVEQPQNVQHSLTQFGYYLRLLYLLSGETIAGFRFTGILILLAATFYFAISLEQYWNIKFAVPRGKKWRWSVVFTLLLACIPYYHRWLLTPSYNWLTLICTILVGASLLNQVRWNFIYRDRAYFWRTCINAAFLGVFGGLAFLAKPTTSVVLAFTSLFWLLVSQIQRRNLYYFILISAITALCVLVFHAFYFKGGIASWIEELVVSMKIEDSLQAGHNLGQIFWQGAKDMYLFFRRIPGFFSFYFLLPIFLLILFSSKRKHFGSLVFPVSISLVILLAGLWYQLWDMGQWEGNKSGLGMLVIALFMLLSLGLVSFVKRSKLTSENELSFELVYLLTFLILLAVSYSFGSNNGLIKQMTGAILFIAAFVLYSGFWIDEKTNNHLLGNAAQLVVVSTVLMLIMAAHNKPYRISTGLAGQVESSSFLMGKGHLLLDKTTAQYVRDMKEVAHDSGWNVGKPLIDLTGASPGALVVLGGRLLGVPWLLGGYEGSEEFATQSLATVNIQQLSEAWILTAPDGKHSVSLQVLSNVGLSFPSNYEKIATLKTGYRQEQQILWRPTNGEQQ